MEPWYKIATPRKEVREGRSFNPDEFAIALEQVVAGRGPDDYRDPTQFFSRTCWTRALQDHAGMILRRLDGQTADTAPVLTLITQFGGGKTHTLTALYHLVRGGEQAQKFNGVPDLLGKASLRRVPEAKVVVFVGNAWDAHEGRETPWIDLAHQIAGDEGVRLLGPNAKQVPPGTETLAAVFRAAGRPVLVLMDEVLNFLNRYKRHDPGIYEVFHAFIQNLTVALMGLQGCAALISLPRSKVEMTEDDTLWQERVIKVVKRVAKDLIANDEAEIAEVVRRRLFEDLGGDRVRKNVAKAYADWCFERRERLPPEWTAVDTASTEAKAREYLRGRFEACYPFHPATLSVFQRKWQALPQYQQTRGTLAMFAQWISWAYREEHIKGRREPLLTLGSAPLDLPAFRAVVLGQLAETRLGTAIDVDIAGEQSHARVLDADTKGPLRDIHRRVGTAILFESSGGQVDKVARLPELRFALGEPDLETTSVDTAAHNLERAAFFISRVGSDGYRIYHKANLKKAVNDRKASLDEEADVRPEMRKLVRKEFEKGAAVPVRFFPDDGDAVEDSPRLTLCVMGPETDWSEEGAVRQQMTEWTTMRGGSRRRYPGAIIWCLKKPGRELRAKIEEWLAWRRVAREVEQGTLGEDYEKADLSELTANVSAAEEDARDEVWASYRYVALADPNEPDGLRRPAIDLGAGHSSGRETLSGRVIAAMKSESLLSETVGVNLLNTNWPPALKESGAWPLEGLRQSFLNGALTRLLDPDSVLRGKIADFVGRGDFGLASGARPDGTYERLWHAELLPADEVTFGADVFLLTRAKARSLKEATRAEGPPAGDKGRAGGPTTEAPPEERTKPREEPGAKPKTRTVRLVGTVPPELWNRLGNKVLVKLRPGTDLKIGVDLCVTFEADAAESVESDLRQILADLGLTQTLRIEEQ